MKHLSWIQKSIAAALIIGSASGMVFADETASATPPEPSCPAPQILKSGWYLGLQGGYDSYRVRNSVNTPAASTLVTNPALAVNGWAGGMMLGYSMLVNNWFQVGAEIFANKNNNKLYFSHSDAGTTYTNKFQVKSSYGIGLLPGIKLTESTLSYIRLGWNGAYVKTTETVTGVAVGSKTNTSNGVVFGVGMETVTAGDWSLRGEFDHTWYNSYKGSAVYGTVITPSDNQFLAAMIYHFA